MRRIALIILVLITLFSCEVFDLRDSQLPTVEAEWNDFATNLELALQNLKYAYEDSRNAINYSRIFYPDFRFYFAPQDITDFSTDAYWLSTHEQDMLLNLHTRYSKINVSLEPLSTADEISASEAKLYRSYQLIAKAADSQEQDIIVHGNLELHYRKQYGYWYIYRWYDYRLPDGHTWGRLKHENS
ncbi:MAG: hypothetical protein RBR69_06010 [Candidatus Cloacimonadaceae bacterium]|jgi:hypothetical protein|nr:hypothetical protein [Candidatus Cloacimonadota bacterium]MCK9242964.1 hypothetical protein [Candidatus Cloacimonadota bacterium]MDD3103143.1 hypothetical protein [Candidatus Cloacimonadota bacterium]MDD3532886.1 hypothetical protein [Candidatus Cloacimonadota bacterium]MDY0127668.1 hypothetical protein [Candidatus Cloacimonadaceae bacterium]